MNTNLASYIVGMVINENDRFYFVQKMAKPTHLIKQKARIKSEKGSRALPMRI